MFCSVSVDGDFVDHLDDSARVSVDFDWDSGATYRCARCGAALVETCDGPETEDGQTHCPAYDTDDLDDPDDGPDDNPDGNESAKDSPHDPERVPLAWVNSAAIDTDEKDDSVTVSISVGDPRGAFSFTVRRVPDTADGELAGRLIMHVPHPGEPLPHERLTELHPGTYLIG